MLKNYIACILFVFAISSCQKPNSTINNSANGIWESIGSGWVLEIKDSTNYQFYDFTSISCLPNREGSFNELEGSITLQNDTLNLLKGVITYQFTRTDILPQLCSNQEADQNLNPIYNFEVFAETVKTHYAFFDLNNIDWNELYLQQKGKLTEKSSDVELYTVIEETLELLSDNHAFLEATDDVYAELDSIADSTEGENNDSENLKEYGDFEVAQLVANHHLQEEMTEDSWLIQWGKMTDEVGFIQVKSMWLYATLDIAPGLIDEVGYVDAYIQTFHKMYEGDYIDKEVEGVSKLMDKIMNDLSEMQSIVIDVRFNGGGQDAVSFAILSRFISEGRLQIATQKLRNGKGFTSVLPLYIEGVENAYTKPVYVLTSPQTGSAAEAFSIATMAMENVQRIGANTSGAMSTALEKTLPNGWPFAISNEVYMDNQGTNYENKGIPADYKLDYPIDRQAFFSSIVNNLGADKNQILEAIQTLKK